MSLDQRVAALERQMQIEHDLLQKAIAFMGQLQGNDEAAGETSRSLLEASQATARLVQEHEDRIQKLVDIVTQQYTTISFTTLMLYWLMHVMERIEHALPYGTVDLIMNSVQESMDDVESAHFYSLFQSLREAGAEDARA